MMNRRTLPTIRPKALIPLTAEQRRREHERLSRDIRALMRQSQETDRPAQDKKDISVKQLEAYYAQVREQVSHSARRYAPKAMHGTVVFSLTLRSNGAFEYTDVMRSSGDPDIDATVFHLIRLSAPFPAVPATVSQDASIVTMPIEFKFSQ